MGLFKWVKDLFSSFDADLEKEKRELALKKLEQEQIKDYHFSKLAAKKTNILKKQNYVFALYKEDDLLNYYPNINNLAKEEQFHPSSVYKAYKDNRTYKDYYIVKECQES